MTMHFIPADNLTSSVQARKANGVFSPMAIIRSFFALFDDIGRARQAQITYERLARMSDNELASRGLTRDELPRHAFDNAFGGH